MGEQMTFPNTWEEYEEFYGFTDSEQIYTNGARLIQSFRVEQWLDHKNVRGEWIVTSDCEGKTRKIICPICKWESGKHQWNNFNYCPNCGADMRPPLDIRDCDHCKHYVTRDGQTGCEKWECEFERRQ